MLTPYEQGFFAGVEAQTNNVFSEKHKQSNCPFPISDTWGDKSYYAVARAEWFRGWENSL